MAERGVTQSYHDPVLSTYYPSTNNGIPDDLVPKCLDHLGKVGQLVTTAKRDVVRLQAELDIAWKHLRNLEHEYASCDSLLSPIRRVPEEVLVSIFLHLLECPRALDSNGISQLTTLQRVCRKWWHATQGSHQLWKGLEVSIPFRTKQPSSPCDFLIPWFRRAGTEGPFSLTLLGKAHLIDGEDLLLCRELARFFARPRPWAVLRFIRIPDHIMTAIFKVVLEETEETQISPWKAVTRLDVDLNLTVHPRISGQPYRLPIIALPSLTYLAIRGSFQPFAHDRLQTLVMRNYAGWLGDILLMLASLPALQNLIIESGIIAGRISTAGPGNAPSAVHTNLTNLELVGKSSLSLLLGLPQLPSLQKLTLREVFNRGDRQTIDTKKLATFVSTLPNLQELHFPDSSILHAGIADIVGHAPTLQRLFVPHIGFFGNWNPRAAVDRTTKCWTEINVASAPSDAQLERLHTFFVHRHACIGHSEPPPPKVRLHVCRGWPRYLILRRDWTSRLAEVGVDMTTEIATD